MKAYEAYRESGVEWIGTIPKQWSAKRLSFLFRVIGSGTTPPTDDGAYYDGELPWVTTGELREAGISDTAKKLTYDALTAFPTLRMYPPGTLLIAMYGATIGRLGWLSVSACTNQACCALAAPQGVIPRFAFFALLAANEALILLASGGGQPNINQEKIRAFRLPVPSLIEQEAIAAFLDQETGKIDALVAEQERLIALLKEKRQAVISQAVTKGLNPNAPMKDSGIEWLGQVPAHWEVKRIGALFAEANQEGELDLPVLSVSIHDGVSDRELADEELDRKVSRSEDRTKYKKVQPGDLVYNMMRAWQGGFGTVTVHGMVSPAYVVARPQDFVRAAFIEMLLRTPFAVEEMRRHSRGVTDFRLRLYWDEFKQINVPVPTTDEQDQILLGVQEIMAQGDTLITEATQAITLLRERRAALISAAVTGKIDVRSLAPTKQEAA